MKRDNRNSFKADKSAGWAQLFRVANLRRTINLGESNSFKAKVKGTRRFFSKGPHNDRIQRGHCKGTHTFLEGRRCCIHDKSPWDGLFWLFCNKFSSYTHIETKHLWESNFYNFNFCARLFLDTDGWERLHYAIICGDNAMHYISVGWLLRNVGLLQLETKIARSIFGFNQMKIFWIWDLLA